MKKQLLYIKANGVYYRPQKPGIMDENKNFGNYPVCLIKKILFGLLWQIDYFDKVYQYTEKGGYSFGDEDIPNQRIILYPLGIEEIKWAIN